VRTVERAKGKLSRELNGKNDFKCGWPIEEYAIDHL